MQARRRRRNRHLRRGGIDQVPWPCVKLEDTNDPRIYYYGNYHLQGLYVDKPNRCGSFTSSQLLRLQVRELQLQYTHKEYRWQAEALMAMQEAAEAHLIKIFEDAYVATMWSLCVE